MINIAFLVIGTSGLIYSLWIYVYDFKDYNKYVTMGTDMSFSHYWTGSVVLISLGLLPLFEYSRCWAFMGYIVGIVSSIVVRFLINKIEG